MPGTPVTQLFVGPTIMPVRGFVAEAVDGYERFVLPCVGRWAVAPAIARRHGAERIEASDLCLVSTLIGYLADRRRSTDELEVNLPERYAPLTDDVVDEAEWAAGVLLAIKLLTLGASSLHALSHRSELWGRRLRYGERVAAGLRAQVAELAGFRYEIRDVRDVAAELMGDYQAERTAFFVDLSTYKGGYAKLYAEAEEAVWPTGTELAGADWDPAETPAMLARLTDSPALVLANLCHGDADMPDGWTKLAAMPLPTKPDDIDYVISNPTLACATRPARSTSRPTPAGRSSPDDDLITTETEVRAVFVDKPTGLYYRDLFVRRLGGSDAELFGLLLLDVR